MALFSQGWRGTLAFVALSLGATVYLFMQGRIMFLSVTILAWTLAVWEIVRYLEAGVLHWEGTDMRKFVAATASMVFTLGGYLVLVFSFGLSLGGINAAAWLLIAGLIFLGLAIFELMDWVFRHTGRREEGLGEWKPMVIMFIGLFILVLLFGPMGWSIAKLPGLMGEVPYEVIEPVTDPVSDTAVYMWNSLTHSEHVARIQCVMEHGGPTGIAFTQSTEISKCVQNKLGRNQTVAESEAVTEPVEMRLEDGDFEVEPFPNDQFVRVGIPLHNTLVQDRNGVPIEIPAEDVDVSVEWIYGTNLLVTDSSKEIGMVPSGATRVVNFGEDSGFETFRIDNQSVTDDGIQQRLFSYVECTQRESGGNETGANESGSVQEQCGVDWFSGVNPKRTAFVVFRTPEISRGEVSELELPEDIKLAPGERYTVRVGVTYTYGTEAAFTESSRWRSKNHLLEVWNLTEWNDMSFEEREAWESRKCGTVERFGQEFERQRTAALTTPVMPVMYASCGASLFREAKKNGDVDISVTASQNSESSQLKEPLRRGWVKILSGEQTGTDCVPSRTLGPIIDRKFTYEPGRGWDFNVATLNKDIDIGGRSISIACKTDMRFRIHYTVIQSYEIPRLGVER